MRSTVKRRNFRKCDGWHVLKGAIKFEWSSRWRHVLCQETRMREEGITVITKNAWCLRAQFP